MKPLQKAMTVVLAAALLVPAQAHAVTSAELEAELDAARVVLEGIYAEAAAQEELLVQTNHDLEETNKELDRVGFELEERQDELADARAVLGKRMRASYKSGGISFLAMLLKSSTFDELISNIYYADKVSEADAESIAAVEQAQTDLTKEEEHLKNLQDEHEKLVEEQSAQKEALEEAEAEQLAYVQGLSVEVQAQLEIERQEEEARRQEEARRAEEEARAQEEAEDASEADDQEKSDEDEADGKEDDTKEQSDDADSQQKSTKQESEAQKSKSQNQSDTKKETTKTQTPAPSTPSTTVEWKDEYNQANYPQRHPHRCETTPEFDAFRANWIAQNIKPGMSTLEKVIKVSDFVSSHPRDRSMRHHTGLNMFLYGDGTCDSSSEMVYLFMKDLGIPCVIRDAAAAAGASNIHYNNFVWVDGVRYIVDANPGYYGAIKPRLG